MTQLEVLTHTMHPSFWDGSHLGKSFSSFPYTQVLLSSLGVCRGLQYEKFRINQGVCCCCSLCGQPGAAELWLRASVQRMHAAAFPSSAGSHLSGLSGQMFSNQIFQVGNLSPSGSRWHFLPFLCCQRLWGVNILSLSSFSSF